MAEKEDDETGLSERVVKEAVGKGMETSMREPIVEAVEEADEAGAKKRRIPLTGAIVGLGAAVGYLVGSRRRGAESEERTVEELIGDEDTEDEVEEVEEAEETGQEEAEDEDSGGSRLRKLFVMAGIAGLIALLRRRRSSSEEDEEWEPIEEFEPAVEPEDGPTADTDEEDDVGITAGEDDEE
ncbi:hypothetical protein ACYJ1Y_09600 [Natrialbaceae archaeon A-gly3]